MTWTADDERLLLDLLATDTTTPMETHRPSDLAIAQGRYAAAAADLGFRTVHEGPADAAVLAGRDVPATVRALAAEMGPDFLATQPNLVLSLGDADAGRTVMFNVHLDTVAGRVPIRCADGLIYGRGAVDDKGPGVALLGGVRAALAERPDLAREIRVLIQVVGGEEGGAMGVYGTRALADLGYVGRLNVVAEPTRNGFLDRSTAAMTLRLAACGTGSTDDEPERGENATILLGFLAVWFARELAPRVHEAGGKLCLAGLRTGDAHNRVYGTGQLLCNFAYADPATGALIESLVERQVDEALTAFDLEFTGCPTTGATAAAARRMLRTEWLKRGLPTLANRDPALEDLLQAAGFRRHPHGGDLRPFTCDAIWLGRPGSYTVVAGPGDLAANNAHADDEHVAVADLAGYARRIAALLTRFTATIHTAP